jgi:hypothetical protein
VTDEAFMSQPVEVLGEPKEKRRKYRRYPKPVCTEVSHMYRAGESRRGCNRPFI